MTGGIRVRISNVVFLLNIVLGAVTVEEVVNMDLSFCPHCGGHMYYDKYSDNLCCDTCSYVIRGIMRDEYLEGFNYDFDSDG
ncbi:MAG: hypothetical protein HDR25_01430 [Lachnospiraceae bacterium]|nr:hypothetical protein [Lachnospiraceae bacterium]